MSKGTDPQQQEEGKEGAEQAACGGLEGGELGVIVAVREHAVEDRDTLDGKAMKEGRISAQQQQGGVARDRQARPTLRTCPYFLRNFFTRSQTM